MGKLAKRVFIIGSCVSRDAWELSPPGGDLVIVDYVARTSIASAFAKPYPLDEEPKVRSNWQLRQLIIDAEKGLEKRLREADFDILLVDLIDERFEIFEKDGAILNNSFAAREAGLGNQALKRGYRMIPMTTPERSRLWVEGWRRLCAVVAEANPGAAIVMNEVQWGTHPKMPLEAKPEMTSEANLYLRTFYRHAQRTANENSRSLIYDGELFKPDPDHKWGIGPFHYGKELYFKTIDQLKTIANELPPRKTKSANNIALPSVSRFAKGELSASERMVVDEAIRARLGVHDYTIDGEYLTFSRANILRNPVVSLDLERGIPVNSTLKHPQPHFNPTTIGYYGLESLSKYLASNDDLHLKAAECVANYAIDTIREDGVWPSPYEHHWFPGRAGKPMPDGWPSALSQGYLLSHLARMYVLDQRPEYVDVGRLALMPFQKTVEEGGVLRRVCGDPLGMLGGAREYYLPFYEEYPTELPSLVLNGFMFALLGLYDFAEATGDETARTLYREGEQTLERMLPFYDLGNNTSYDLTHLHPVNWATPPNACRKGYHQTHMIELSAFNILERRKYESVYLRWALYDRGVSIKGN